VATLNYTDKEERELGSIFYVGVSDKGKLVHKQLKTKKYANLFKGAKTTEIIEKLDQKLSQKTKLEFPLIAIVKMKILTEVFSLQNLQSIVEINKFKQSLPSLEKLASILTELSNGDKIASLDDKELKESEEEKSTLIENLPAINQFLSKGITIKTREDKTIILKKDSEGKGYLGLDLEKLREIIRTKFPQILLEK
jgi:hypothetical protein